MSRPQSTVHSRQQPQQLFVCGLWTVVCGLSVLFSIAGCGPPANPRSLREEALKADPAFQEILEKRDELAQRIELLERELDLKRSQVEAQIVKLRNDLKEVRRQVEQKTQRTTALLKPDQERLDLAMSMATEERRAKRNQRASLGRSISRLQRALKQTTPPWPAAERKKMETELQELRRETERVDREIAVLNEHLRLLKIKRLLLRL